MGEFKVEMWQIIHQTLEESEFPKDKHSWALEKKKKKNSAL